MANLATVVMAAGKGTRMKSDLPKVLHPLNDRPMVNYVIDAAKAVGSDKTVLIVGHKKELVIETIQDDGVEFAVQSPQLGTGHAVMQAAPNLKNFEGNVLVLSGDVPLLQAGTLRRLIDIHESEGALATLLTTNMDDPTGYGRIVRDENNFVRKIVEEKDADDEIREIQEINVGIYIFTAKELFATLPQVTNNNRQGEYYLPDVVKIYVDRNEKVAAVLTEDVEETHGINTVDQLKNAEEILMARIAE